MAAAAATLGWAVLASAAFWWCVAGTAAIGAMDIGLSFYLAFKVALRSRRVQMKDPCRIVAALGQRWRSQPASFFGPPAEP